MNFDFAKTENTKKTVVVELETVYKLQADSSYDVKGSRKNRKGWLIALRTTGGSGSVKLEGFAPKIVTANTLLLFKHDQVTRYHCQKDKWDFWWFEFKLKGSFPLPLNDVLNISRVDGEINDCNNCMELLRKDNNNAQSLASATLSYLLYKFLYHLDAKKQIIRPHQEEIEKVVEYMYNNLNKNLQIEELAVITGFTPRYFRKIFKEIIGESPKKYYDSLKLKMALELLNKTSLTISEISVKLAYSSPFHFTKVFKKYYGFSPSKYRNSFIKGK